MLSPTFKEFEANYLRDIANGQILYKAVSTFCLLLNTEAKLVGFGKIDTICHKMPLPQIFFTNVVPDPSNMNMHNFYMCVDRRCLMGLLTCVITCVHKYVLDWDPGHFSH